MSGNATLILIVLVLIPVLCPRTLSLEYYLKQSNTGPSLCAAGDIARTFSRAALKPMPHFQFNQ